MIAFVDRKQWAAISVRHYYRRQRSTLRSKLRLSFHFITNAEHMVKLFSNAEMGLAIDWLGAQNADTNLNAIFHANLGVVVLEPHAHLLKEDFDELPSWLILTLKSMAE